VGIVKSIEDLYAFRTNSEDRRVTQRLAEAGQLLGIELLDHIIGDNRWVSLKERGLL